MVPEKQMTTSTAKNVTASNDEMRIAWRYNNLDKVDSEQGNVNQRDGKNSYTFDLSQSIEDDTLSSLDITLFGKDEIIHSNKINSIFHNPDYVSLIQKLREKMNESTFDSSSQTATTKKNLLRICIESLGSPHWYDDHCTDDFCLFLTILKAAVRVSLSVCCITAPAHLFKYIVSESYHLSLHS